MDRRNTLKRIFAIVLCAAMLSASSCKSKKKGDKQDRKSDVVLETDPFFQVEEHELLIPSPADKEILSCSLESPVVTGKTISVTYFIEYKMPPELQNSTDYDTVMAYREDGRAVFDLNGNFLRKTPRVMHVEPGERTPVSEYILQVTEGPNGEGYAIVMRDQEEEGFYFCKISDTGELDKGIRLNGEFTDLSDSQVLFTEDGHIVIGSWEYIAIYDKNGNLQNGFFCEGFQGHLLQQDGKYYAALNNVTGTTFEERYAYIQQIDIEKGVLTGEKIKNPQAMLMVRGKDGSYLQNTNGIVKVDLLSSQKTQVMEWSQCDYYFSSANARSFKILSDDEIVFFLEKINAYSDGGDNSMHITAAHFSRMEKNPYAGKPIIRVAENDSAQFSAVVSGIMPDVISYNTSADAKSRIVVHDYSADMDSALSRLQQQASISDIVYQELISGNGPDILVNFSEYPKFNTGECLLDLNTLIDDKENGLDRSLYFDAILRAGEQNGKLYHIPICYGIMGILGNTDLLGDPKPWTYDEFFSAIDKLPDDVEVLDEFLQPIENMYPRFFACLGRDLIDYDKKEVHLTDDSFKKLLEFSKRYGTEKTESELWNIRLTQGTVDAWTKFDEGLLAFLGADTADIRYYAQLITKNNGHAALYPIPSVGAKGLYANPIVSIGISKTSSHTSEAWDFIRFLMSDDVQFEKCKNTGFPINRKALDDVLSYYNKMYEEALTKQKETDEIYLPMKLDKSVTDRLKKDIESIGGLCGSDPNILMIMLEEAPACILGQKSVDDVASIIENRARTFVREQ
ncbi:MAG: extracellular solute-binding protein [Clostridiales bacterium]|nr:extracellular solute-binding protein [Clostridiales bacterium]